MCKRRQTEGLLHSGMLILEESIRVFPFCEQYIEMLVFLNGIQLELNTHTCVI